MTPLARLTPTTTHGSVYDGLLGSDASQWAFGTDFEDPLAGVDTTVPDGVDAADAGGVLPDARRRRARLLPPALASGAATRPTSRRTSRWPTSRSTCSARPGCCSPAPRPPTRRVVPGAARGVAGAARGRAGVLPRGRRRSATCGWSRSTTATSRTTIARLLLFSTVRLAVVRAAGRAAATRCWRRSRPRASRSSPTTATTPAGGSSPWPRAPTSRGAGCWPR